MERPLECEIHFNFEGIEGPDNERSLVYIALREMLGILTLAPHSGGPHNTHSVGPVFISILTHDLIP